MIEIYLSSIKSCNISKESVGAWVFSLLNSRYHDDGLNNYFNGSKVKAHSYYLEKEVVKKDEVFKIELRGIEQLESIIMKKLVVGEKIRIGKFYFIIYHLEKVGIDKKIIYDIKTPLIMRNENKTYRHEDYQLRSLNNLIEESIRRKYRLIYGYDLLGLESINLINKKPVKFDIKIKGNRISHFGYLGKVEILGNDEAVEFILNVGIGNRTTYGYGYIS